MPMKKGELLKKLKRAASKLEEFEVTYEDEDWDEVLFDLEEKRIEDHGIFNIGSQFRVDGGFVESTISVGTEKVVHSRATAQAFKESLEREFKHEENCEVFTDEPGSEDFLVGVACARSRKFDPKVEDETDMVNFFVNTVKNEKARISQKVIESWDNR